jgi:hypothetical protein
VLSAEFLDECIRFAQREAQSAFDDDNLLSSATTSATTSALSSLGIGGDAASSATSYSPDPYAVSNAEALSYYAGLPSEPTLLYRMGKQQWSPPRGPEAQQRLKELCAVFNHPIAKFWNSDLAWRVVEVMDAHKVS